MPNGYGTKIAQCASMTIFSVDLLNDEFIIDQTFSTRISLVESLAEQWFGVFVFPKGIADSWLTVGLSRYLAIQFFKKHFGQNEVLYRLRVKKSFPHFISPHSHLLTLFLSFLVFRLSLIQFASKTSSNQLWQTIFQIQMKPGLNLFAKRSGRFGFSYPL